jgi:hypothetical protein
VVGAGTDRPAACSKSLPAKQVQSPLYSVPQRHLRWAWLNAHFV